MKREYDITFHSAYPGMVPLSEQAGGRKQRRERKKALISQPLYIRKLSPPKGI